MNGDNLFKLGFSYLGAAVPARERASVPESESGALAARLRGELGLEEAVLLSTCSRLELYAAARDVAASAQAVRDWFLSREASIEASLRFVGGEAALGALFRVAAGLDSWILGESEILGQVRRAYESARTAGATGPALNRVFQSAIAAGKAARSKTAIQNGVSSIGGAAALLARQIFGEAAGGSAAVFGAGEAAEAVVRHLHAKKFADIFVLNRTAARAEELARRVGGAPLPIERFDEALGRVDVAIFSTASPVPLLEEAALRCVLAGRRGRPLFLVDLGMPRNVSADCARVPGAYLYDLDDLERVVARSLSEKAAEKTKAEEIAAEAARRCAAELRKAATKAVPQETLRT